MNRCFFFFFIWCFLFITQATIRMLSSLKSNVDRYFLMKHVCRSNAARIQIQVQKYTTIMNIAYYICWLCVFLLNVLQWGYHFCYDFAELLYHFAPSLSLFFITTFWTIFSVGCTAHFLFIVIKAWKTRPGWWQLSKPNTSQQLVFAEHQNNANSLIGSYYVFFFFIFTTPFSLSLSCRVQSLHPHYGVATLQFGMTRMIRCWVDSYNLYFVEKTTEKWLK